jgi:putative oxidoreductase
VARGRLALRVGSLPDSLSGEVMKITSLIARLLLGALFVFAGANHVFNFFKGPLPPGVAGQFVGAMIATGYMSFIGACEVIGGLILLSGWFLPFGLVVLGPIVINISVVNLLIAPKALPVAVVMILLWLLAAWRVRTVFSPLIKARVEE